MWTGFFVAMLAAAVFLYVPGFCALKALRMESVVAFCCAPLASIPLYTLLSTVYPSLGVFASWGSLFAPATAAGLIAWAVSFFATRRRAPRFARADSCGSFLAGRLSADWSILAAYIVVGFVSTGMLFVGNLASPESFLQSWDNVHHLSSVQAFFESGNYSSFTTSSYAAPVDRAIDPFASDSAFYPSAWHCIAAMAMGASGASCATAINAVNAVLAAVVLPAGMFMLLRTLFSGKRAVVYAGAFVTTVFAAFPWGFLTFGPLYPNLLSYVLIPSVAAMFVKAFAPKEAVWQRVVFAFVFFLGLVSLAISQPNAVFSLGVFLAPYCVVSAMRIGDCAKISDRVRPVAKVALATGAVLAIAGIWCVMYKMPFLSAVVGFDWPAKTSPVQAIANIGLLSFVETPAQPLLALLVAVGIVAALVDRSRRWVVFSYAFACIIYFFDMATDGFLKHLLSGFWYTDQWRTAAMAALFAVPLAAWGAATVARGAKSIVVRLATPGDNALRYGRCVMAATPLVLAAFIAFPSFDFAGSHRIETAYTTVGGRVETQNADVPLNFLGDDERRFVEQVREIVPEDQVLINEPDDGSVFLYGLDGVRIYYRYFTGYGLESGESSDSFLIRGHLDEIAFNEEVREAVDNIGAEYVLVLDQGDAEPCGPAGESRRFLPYHGVHKEAWQGIVEIDDETPGFEAVLSEGDMRLYRIVA